jgi:hypothetical protein
MTSPRLAAPLALQNSPPAPGSTAAGCDGVAPPRRHQHLACPPKAAAGGAKGMSGCISTVASNRLGRPELHRGQDIGAVGIAEPQHACAGLAASQPARARRKSAIAAVRCREVGHVVDALRRCGGNSASAPCSLTSPRGATRAAPGTQFVLPGRRTGSRPRPCRGTGRSAAPLASAPSAAARN